jgi:hypothetical protein
MQSCSPLPLAAMDMPSKTQFLVSLGPLPHHIPSPPLSLCHAFLCQELGKGLQASWSIRVVRRPLPGERGRGEKKEDSSDLPLWYLLPSVNSACWPSPGQPQPHTRGDRVFGHSETLTRPPLFSSLMKGLLKSRLPDKMTGQSFRVMDGTQEVTERIPLCRGV